MKLKVEYRNHVFHAESNRTIQQKFEETAFFTPFFVFKFTPNYSAPSESEVTYLGWDSKLKHGYVAVVHQGKLDSYHQTANLELIIAGLRRSDNLNFCGDQDENGVNRITKIPANLHEVLHKEIFDTRMRDETFTFDDIKISEDNSEDF